VVVARVRKDAGSVLATALTSATREQKMENRSVATGRCQIVLTR
jgi:hypothetical protein